MMSDLVSRVQEALTDDLRRRPWKGSPNPLAGHCYVACEALYHILGSEWCPCFIQHEDAPHWFLRHRETGAILDPTASQFKTPVPYHEGRGKGFLTKQPSKRASVVISRVSAY